jgi:hypothetical protein
MPSPVEIMYQRISVLRIRRMVKHSMEARRDSYSAVSPCGVLASS